MLYETVGQPIVFLSLLAAGLGCGLLFDGAKLLSALCNKNKIVMHIFLFLATICSGAVFYLVNLATNFGQLRLYTILTFIAAIVLEQVSIGKLFAKLIQKCYNRFNGRREKKKNP